MAEPNDVWENSILPERTTTSWTFWTSLHLANDYLEHLRRWREERDLVIIHFSRSWRQTGTIGAVLFGNFFWIPSVNKQPFGGQFWPNDWIHPAVVLTDYGGGRPQRTYTHAVGPMMARPPDCGVVSDNSLGEVWTESEEQRVSCLLYFGGSRGEGLVSGLGMLGVGMSGRVCWIMSIPFWMHAF